MRLTDWYSLLKETIYRLFTRMAPHILALESSGIRAFSSMVMACSQIQTHLMSIEETGNMIKEMGRLRFLLINALFFQVGLKMIERFLEH